MDSDPCLSPVVQSVGCTEIMHPASIISLEKKKKKTLICSATILVSPSLVVQHFQ